MDESTRCYFMVMGIKFSHPIEIKDDFGSIISKDIELVWANGMIGCLPVFSDLDSAMEYADGKFPVVAIQDKETMQ